MGFAETMITVLMTAMALSVTLSVWEFFKLRGERKFTSKGAVRTRPPKMVSIFFLGFALLVLGGGIGGIIYCCIADSENTTVAQIIVIAVCSFVFSGIAIFGYAWIRFNYIVADNEGVIVCRLFRKKKYYRYEEILNFQDNSKSGVLGGVTGYDKNNKKIFEVDGLHIGVSAVGQRLREHGIAERGITVIRPKI